MTNPSSDVLERLRRRHMVPDFGFALGQLVKVGERPGDLVNPDGPEAAATIERLSAELELLREAVRVIAAGHGCPNAVASDALAKVAALTTVENSATQTERG